MGAWGARKRGPVQLLYVAPSRVGDGVNSNFTRHSTDERGNIHQREVRLSIMAKNRKTPKSISTGRPPREKLSAEESIKWVREFSKRKEQFIAAVRTGKCRSLSA